MLNPLDCTCVCVCVCVCTCACACACVCLMLYHLHVLVQIGSLFMALLKKYTMHSSVMMMNGYNDLIIHSLSIAETYIILIIVASEGESEIVVRHVNFLVA